MKKKSLKLSTLKEKRDAKKREIGDDPVVAIDKMVEQKAKEMIEKESKKENNDPKVEKKSRFSHLAERQECWNDEFQVFVVSKFCKILCFNMYLYYNECNDHG